MALAYLQDPGLSQVMITPAVGNTIHHGGVVPTSQGVDGDFYVDTADPMAMYGPKAPAGWGPGLQLIGPTGPAGSPGSAGTPGAAATIAIGTVFTGAAGSSATVTNTGSSAAAVLAFAVPQGAAGANGANGAAGVNAFGFPTGRTVVFATSYQATTPAKPAIIGVEIECAVTVALGSAQANTVELIIGATSGVASGTGAKVDTMRTDLSVSILLSLGFTNRQFLQASLPANGYFAVRRTAGTACSVISAFDQAVG